MIPNSAGIRSALVSTRATLGLTQVQMGRVLGCTSRTIINWEKDPSTMTVAHLLALQAAMEKAGLDMDAFLKVPAKRRK